jgi:hypothetical protein
MVPREYPYKNLISFLSVPGCVVDAKYLLPHGPPLQAARERYSAWASPAAGSAGGPASGAPGTEPGPLERYTGRKR